MSAVAPSRAAHDRARQLSRSRETSRTPSSMRSNMTSSSVMGRVEAFSPDAAEAEVTCRCVDLLGMARRRPIASAIVRRAEMRAALDDLAVDADVRRGRVVAAVLAPAARVLRDAAGFRRVTLVLLRVPVGCPFPDIADHVVDAMTVRRERGDWGGPLEAVAVRVLPRKLALPGVGHVPAVRRQLVAPCVVGAVEAAARRKLPFGFARELLAGPLRVGKRVAEGDMHDGMVVERIDVALRPVRVPPVGALGERPPLAIIAQVDRVPWRRERQ